MSQITYTEFNRAAKFFQALHKDEIEFTINYTNQYTAHGYVYEFSPLISNLNDLEKLAKVFSSRNVPIPSTSFYSSNQPFFRKVAGIINSQLASRQDEKIQNSPIKFCSEVLPTVKGLSVYLLTKPPMEELFNKNTYRVVASTLKDRYGNSISGYNNIVACVNQDNKLYNYLDQNHVLVFADSTSKDGIFVTDQFTLDVNYLAIIFSLHSEALDTVLQNEIFINSKTARMSLLKAEKALPPRFQEQYRRLKDLVLADFEKNAQNTMVSKLLRKEIQTLTMHDIKLTPSKSEYETISIEADDLQEIVFKKLNPNEEFDIYTFISIYTDYVENTLASRPCDDTGLKFKEDFSLKFNINGMDIEAGVSKKNTRRKINGMPINKNELSKVIRRAACFEKLDDFNAFVKKVSKLSLYMTDVINRGLPVKTYIFGYNDYGPATDRHPKLRLKRVNKSFHLVIDENTSLRISKVGELVKEIKKINSRAHRDYNVSHEGAVTKKKSEELNWAERELKTLIPQYVAGITEEQLLILLKTIKKERLAAEETSKKLLEDAVKLTGAVKGTRGGLAGYTVHGSKKEYFVEEESLKVFEAATNEYICIVNKSEQGVGADALVARLFTLKNDQRITGAVNTLAKHV